MATPLTRVSAGLVYSGVPVPLALPYRVKITVPVGLLPVTVAVSLIDWPT